MRTPIFITASVFITVLVLAASYIFGGGTHYGYLPSLYPFMSQALLAQFGPDRVPQYVVIICCLCYWPILGSAAEVAFRLMRRIRMRSSAA
jgi:hypothetical protein